MAMTVGRATGRAAGKGKGKRPDPKRREINGAPALSRLQNQDPRRAYIWVPGGDKNAMSTYRYHGYTVEKYREGGVCPLGNVASEEDGDGLKVGAPITGPYGAVLMSCSIERKQEIDQFGPEGTSGQEDVDALENKIVDNRGGYDPLRGMGGTRRRDGTVYVATENETGPLEEEEAFGL